MNSDLFKYNVTNKLFAYRLYIYIYIYIYINTHTSLYIVQLEGNSIWLSSHYNFIPLEDIIILSVSSDDFLHVRLEVAEQQLWNYSSYVYKEKKILR